MCPGGEYSHPFRYRRVSCISRLSRKTFFSYEHRPVKKGVDLWTHKLTNPSSPRSEILLSSPSLLAVIPFVRFPWKRRLLVFILNGHGSKPDERIFDDQQVLI